MSEHKNRPTTNHIEDRRVPEKENMDKTIISDFSIPVKGSRLNERYTLLERLGKGGMGQVFAAEDEMLNRVCAVKIIHPYLAREKNVLTRFRSEAEKAARINHPNVIQILDISMSDNSCPFFVMEKFEGIDLKQTMQQKEFSWDWFHKILEQIILGLRAGHKSGVIHRDIKPENILVNDEGYVKIVDFGLAKAIDIDSSIEGQLTKTGEVMGTPYYMSPEQCHGHKGVDFKSDIYSAGATFFHLLSGKPPFQNDSYVKIMMMHCQEERPKIHHIRQDCPRHLSSLIESMMAIKVEERIGFSEILNALKDGTYDIHNSNSSMLGEAENNTHADSQKIPQVKRKLPAILGKPLFWLAIFLFLTPVLLTVFFVAFQNRHQIHSFTKRVILNPFENSIQTEPQKDKKILSDKNSRGIIDESGKDVINRH